MSDYQTPLENYHAHVTGYLSQKCPWLQSVRDYPETETELATPCAFLTIDGWDAAGDDAAHCGPTSVTLDCQILVLVSLNTTDERGAGARSYQRLVRDAAAALSVCVSDSALGMNGHRCVFVNAQPYGFDPGLDGYATWEVRYKHTVDFGDDLFAGDGQTPGQVLVGIKPAIGPAHINEYNRVN
ncbi:MAG: hypothetical protein CENE_02662 [Candidatus Celerinatantimonas neptuna]|nr:MAG: hypothetical protein CENE_02662 [Candidatus Celerinatantimonas neptuna]